MKRTAAIALLLIVNLGLTIALVVQLASRPATKATVASEAASTLIETQPAGAEKVTIAPLRAAGPKRAATNAAAQTPFAQVYSADSKHFAANLRAIHCPEETVKDIITAEINRRFQEREHALRFKPADHVPLGWSPATSEPALLHRKQEAKALRQEKADAMREALGYEIPVPIPRYAVSAPEKEFEDGLSTVPDEKAQALRQLYDSYWASVRSLQQRTKNFWQSADIAELERLKAQLRQSMESVMGAR